MIDSGAELFDPERHVAARAEPICLDDGQTLGAPGRNEQVPAVLGRVQSPVERDARRPVAALSEQDEAEHPECIGSARGRLDSCAEDRHRPTRQTSSSTWPMSPDTRWPLFLWRRRSVAGRARCRRPGRCHARMGTQSSIAKPQARIPHMMRSSRSRSSPSMQTGSRLRGWRERCGRHSRSRPRRRLCTGSLTKTLRALTPQALPGAVRAQFRVRRGDHQGLCAEVSECQFRGCLGFRAVIAQARRQRGVRHHQQCAADSGDRKSVV